jgi:RHS repeat-associated protein
LKTCKFLYMNQCEIGSVNEKGIISELRVLGNGLGAEIGAAIAVELGGVTYAPLHDHIGNLVCLVSIETGLPVASYRYSAFGVLESFFGNVTSPWLFSSKRADAESNFIYFGRRYYSPNEGRWITKDPLGDRDGPNLYAYVQNRPLTLFDLFGLLGQTGHRGHAVRSSVSWTLNKLNSTISYAGSTIETIGRELFTPLDPFRYSLEGAGRFLQGNVNVFTRSWDASCVANKIDGWSKLDMWVGALTGVGTTIEGGIHFGKQISKYMHGTEVNCLTHPSRGMVWDLCYAAITVAGFQTQATRYYANMIANAYYTMKDNGIENPRLYLYAHSRGGAELARAMELIPNEVKKNMHVYTFGTAYFIEPSGVADAQNYVNGRDMVPLLSEIYSPCNKSNVVSTTHPSRNFLSFITDHFLSSPGYNLTIRRLCKNIIEKEVSYE